MRVTVDEIKAKLEALPPSWQTMVHLGAPGHAEVESATDPTKTYSVAIRTHKDDPGDRSILDATCTCAAVKLCWHVAGVYAKAKGLTGGTVSPHSDSQESATQEKSAPSPIGRMAVAVDYLGLAVEAIVDEVQARVERKMKEGR